MKKEMIFASTALNLSQSHNRDMWLQATMNRLSNDIRSATNSGLRHLDICPHQLTIGAENLYEVSEMLHCLDKELKKHGYTTKQDPNGRFTINW